MIFFMMVWFKVKAVNLIFFNIRIVHQDIIIQTNAKILQEYCLAWLEKSGFAIPPLKLSN